MGICRGLGKEGCLMVQVCVMKRGNCEEIDTNHKLGCIIFAVKSWLTQDKARNHKFLDIL